MPYSDDLEKAREDLLRALTSYVPPGFAADMARAIEVMIDVKLRGRFPLRRMS